MKKLFLVLAFIFCTLPVFGQTSINGRIDVGPLAARPSLCVPADTWNQTDSPYATYVCGPSNTWTNTTVQSILPLANQTLDANGVSLTQRPEFNFISGANVTVSCVDNSGVTRTDCTIAGTGTSGLLASNNTWTANQIFGGSIPWTDATRYGVRTFTNPPNTITVTSLGGSPTVTTTGVSDFVVNDGIVIPQAGAATIQSTPSAPTVAVIGATGAATINYKLVGVDSLWGLTAASSAGTITTAPTVFGVTAVGITSIVRASNVVTVTTSSTMQFSSGTFRVRIANVTGGTTQFSGLQDATVTSGTTLTYPQTGANESGTVAASSYVRFTNGFIVTTAQATAGSNQVVLTTDINHNIPFISSGSRPVRIFVDGIQFSSAVPQGYANGTFAVQAVTANTITINTSYTSPITTTGVASGAISYATSGVAQMTVEVYPVVDITGPALSGNTKFYAVYGNYGSGYAPIGFTPWGTNIFEDYGPGYTQSGLILPPAMNLPATPPVAAQNQVYTGQITNIFNTTLTVAPNVPTTVTSVTAYHDDGVPLLNALKASCSDGTGAGLNVSGFGSVYLPRTPPSGGGTSYVWISAPLDLSRDCNRTNILDGSPMWLNGPLIAPGSAFLDWRRPADIAAWSNISSGANSKGQNYIFGYAPTMIVSPGQAMHFSGMQVSLLSNGQVGLEVNNASNVNIEDSSFLCGAAGHDLSAIPLYYYNAQFGAQMHDITTSCAADVMYPIAQVGAPPLGEIGYWPVPNIEIAGAYQPRLKIDGINYGQNRGIQFDNLYPNLHTLPSADISDYDTFQAPQQGLVNVYGGDILEELVLRRTIGDSNSNALVACILVGTTGCAVTFTNEKSSGAGGNPILSGQPFRSSYESPINGVSPAQNSNETVYNTTGIQKYGPSSGTNSPDSIYCEGGTGNALSIFDTTQTARTGITCPGGLLSIGGTTTSKGVFTHANTADRTYTTPDISGTFPTFTITPTVGDSVTWATATGQLGDSGGKGPWYTITPVSGQCLIWNGVLGQLGQQACPGGGGGMDQNMDNMSTPTLMNASLIPAAANTIAVGSSALPFTNIFIGLAANQAESLDTSGLTNNRTTKVPNANTVIPQPLVAVTHQFATALNGTTGIISLSQPTLADIAAGASPSGTFDFSGATLFKLPAGAGFASTANDIGFDTTHNNIHAWINGADAVIPGVVPATPVNGDCATWLVTSSNITLGDSGCVSAASTTTFTNKTYNAESTGNSLSIPIRATFPAAGCGGSGSTPGNGWDFGTTNIPTAQCVGATVRKGVLQVARGNVAYLNWHLPPDWNSSASTDIELLFTTTDTTNGHVTSFNIQTACNKTDGTATDDPALNSSQALSVTTGASQVSGGELKGTLTGMTMTGCSADYAFEIVITRNNSGTDTNTDTAVSLKQAEVVIGVTKNAANR